MHWPKLAWNCTAYRYVRGCVRDGRLPEIATCAGWASSGFLFRSCDRDGREPGCKSDACMPWTTGAVIHDSVRCSVSVSYYLVKSNAVRGFGEASVSALGGSDRCRSLSRGSRPWQADEGSMVMSYFRRLDRFAILSSQGGDAELRMHAEVCR